MDKTKNTVKSNCQLSPDQQATSRSTNYLINSDETDMNYDKKGLF